MAEPVTTAKQIHRCSVCGRIITSAASIARGTGTTCWDRTGHCRPGRNGATARDRAHRRRKAMRAKRMAQEMYEQDQMKFPFMDTRKEHAA